MIYKQLNNVGLTTGKALTSFRATGEQVTTIEFVIKTNSPVDFILKVKVDGTEVDSFAVQTDSTLNIERPVTNSPQKFSNVEIVCGPLQSGRFLKTLTILF